MRRIAAIMAFALLLALRPGAELNAQLWSTPTPGSDIATIAVHAGSNAPRTTFFDGSSFESAPTFGVSATGWAFRFLGFRANVFTAQNDGTNPTDPAAALAVQDPRVWFYSGEVVLRYPLDTGAMVLFPYVGAGVGGKSWYWQVKTFADAWLAWTGSVGAEIRPRALGPVGLIAELRGYRSEFDKFGYEQHYYHEAAMQMPVATETQAYWGFGCDPNRGLLDKCPTQYHNDLLFTAGVTINF